MTLQERAYAIAYILLGEVIDPTESDIEKIESELRAAVDLAFKDGFDTASEDIPGIEKDARNEALEKAAQVAEATLSVTGMQIAAGIRALKEAK